ACFTTFSNILFDAEYEFDSVDDQSLHNEDFPEEIFSNPLFEEEINSMRIGQHHFNAESDLIGSLLNHDLLSFPLLRRLILFSMSFPVNSLFSNQFRKEFMKLIIILRMKFVFPKDSNSSMVEIDLTFTPDDPILPSIEEDDDDSRDILIRKELLDNYSLPLPENESFHFDIPLSSRPPAKPPDGNTGILNIKMKGDVSDQKVPIPELMITLVSNQEKSPDL
nr:hypothetical protein [Tanacetum cinerariifolium]